MAKRWYVVHAYSGFEKHVKRALEERIKLRGMEDDFGDILVPTEEVVEIKGGQKRKSERKFFPGYVLVQMEMNDGTWHLIKETPKVLGFIGGTPDKPSPITDREADAILRRMDDSTDKPKPKTLFEPGEVVRVTDGPFADFNGVVEEVNYEKSRLQVAVLIFGRSTPVELEFGQVEKS
ncbi:transcription termination/antitermination protein NusG [Isoalcanivorax indicus]|uniref:transcription termination/antitermination protein NusG n=1 Tax=Isoalcanivorax indicus TaxID=2202653 RepID=UPI000DBA3D13|nr:transcription termination/antitermination protein NusG [Isoalcanivorax indicus]